MPLPPLPPPPCLPSPPHRTRTTDIVAVLMGTASPGFWFKGFPFLCFMFYSIAIISLGPPTITTDMMLVVGRAHTIPEAHTRD